MFSYYLCIAADHVAMEVDNMQFFIHVALWAERER